MLVFFCINYATSYLEEETISKMVNDTKSYSNLQRVAISKSRARYMCNSKQTQILKQVKYL